MLVASDKELMQVQAIRGSWDLALLWLSSSDGKLWHSSRNCEFKYFYITYECNILSMYCLFWAIHVQQEAPHTEKLEVISIGFYPKKSPKYFN